MPKEASAAVFGYGETSQMPSANQAGAGKGRVKCG
jgi:hypothetical protein